ncbi:MAG: 3-dehydroquinate synthase [Flaviaesturariibacter sp.]|nr:3-dehydroquinate synthase [Flaviaesturariibacter sp.]
MQKKTVRFTNTSVDYYFAGGFSHLKEIVDKRNTFILTDEHVFKLHEKRFKNWDTIVLKPGEEFKVQATVDSVIEQLIALGADRKATLVGVGGGVITDLTGYIASVYMRGISFGFVPTTLLALVDASIGGKNGIDVGVYKNMVGTIRQPGFILHDLVFLNTLPDHEWRNGFAEIIKHAAIKDASLFKELEQHDIAFYQKRKTMACQLVQRNALLKTRVVQSDEFEKGDRKLLNFGHTLGHALENQYELSHGEAISIGMAYAAKLSQELLHFRHASKVSNLLAQYGLPITALFDKEKAINVLKMDKKKEADTIHFILLERIGRAVIKPISISQLYQVI